MGELREAQDAGVWANTTAPETDFATAIDRLNGVGNLTLGISIFRQHQQISTLLEQTHRFRAVDLYGLFALAKDVVRLTAESFDTDSLQSIVAPPKGEKWGSLKSLEHVVAKYSDENTAYDLLGPLHAAYNLRLADAHLPGENTAEALELAGIDPSVPFVLQGAQLLQTCANAINAIARALSHGVSPNASS